MRRSVVSVSSADQEELRHFVEQACARHHSNTDAAIGALFDVAYEALLSARSTPIAGDTPEKSYSYVKHAIKTILVYVDEEDDDANGKESAATYAKRWQADVAAQIRALNCEPRPSKSECVKKRRRTPKKKKRKKMLTQPSIAREERAKEWAELANRMRMKAPAATGGERAAPATRMPASTNKPPTPMPATPLPL
jgi:hypothetical protein